MEIVTANRLGDGRVVFQATSGWSEGIDDAEVLESKTAVELAIARANRDAAANRVVEPYAIEVKRTAAGLVPLRLRERIRAEGPSAGHSHRRPAVRDEAA
jgi:hypothetical protein